MTGRTLLADLPLTSSLDYVNWEPHLRLLDNFWFLVFFRLFESLHDLTSFTILFSKAN